VTLFFASGLDDEVRPKGRPSVETLHKMECKACPLDKADVNSPKIEPHGAKNPDIYILGEGPGEGEDKKGEFFVGRSGKFLRGSFPKEIRKKLRYNNCVRTRPASTKLGETNKNRAPTYFEQECCRPSVVRDIEKAKPKVVVGLGNVPLQWATKGEKISLWRGRFVPVKIGSHVCWFYPVYHPAGFLRRRKEIRGRVVFSDEEQIYERDIAWLLEIIDDLPTPEVEDLDRVYDGVETVLGTNGSKDLRKVKKQLEYFAKKPIVGLDYETNMLRPYGTGAKVLSVAVATEIEAFAFPFDHPQAGWTDEERKEIYQLWLRFLKKAKCRKVAHSLPFELEWTAYFYGDKLVRVGRWDCTLAQAFILDERRGMLSLDTLCMIRFGFWLKSISPIDRSNLENEPLDAVLLYNALDSKYECKLFILQDKILENEELLEAYEDQVRRPATVALTQKFGVCIDQDENRRLGKQLEKQLRGIEADLADLDVVHEFEDKFHPFNAGSPPDVDKMLSSILGIHDLEDTKEETIQEIDHPVIQLIVQFRKISRRKSTNVDSISEDGGKYLWPDGLLHPTLNPNGARTGRMSSNSPNEQNFEKRDPEGRKVRSQFNTPKGFVFFSVDYKQLETSVIGMASKDKILCDLLNQRVDIHQLWTERVAHEYPRRIGGKRMIKDKEVMAEFRYDIKNQFVFPLFFGASPHSVSGYLNIPIQNIGPVVDDFWDMFSGVKDWQERELDKYEEYGYVECLTGRRRRGPLAGNKIINSPIQGTAADIAIDAMNRLSKHYTDTGISQYQARLYIHDELDFYLPESSLEDDVEFIIKEMVTSPYSFINVPVAVDASIGPNWYELESIGSFYSDDF